MKTKQKHLASQSSFKKCTIEKEKALLSADLEKWDYKKQQKQRNFI